MCECRSRKREGEKTTTVGHRVEVTIVVIFHCSSRGSRKIRTLISGTPGGRSTAVLAKLKCGSRDRR